MASPPENRPPFSEPDPKDRSELEAGSPLHFAPSEDLHELLAHWDELSDIDLARLQAFPEARAKLQRLRQAQSWLENSLLAQQECPGPEELFALGLPFTGGSLEVERRAEIQEHLHLCPDCASDYQTLSLRPPAPLVVAPPERLDTPSPQVVTGQVSPALRRLRAFTIAAAALMLAWLFVGRDRVSSTNSVRASGGTWPPTTTLRGAAPSILRFPRGKQLARNADATWSGTLRWQSEPDAQGYRIIILQNDGSALDMGTQIYAESTLDPDLILPTPLPAGHYTVALFATVFGLEKPLGNAEFRVVQAPDILSQLDDLQGLARVRFLHDKGWWSDALLEARKLPESPERTRYIGAMEAR